MGNMLEKVIEKRLVEEVKKRKGLCLKFVSPGTVGVPDRLILLALKRIAFVEVKAPGQTLRPIQRKRKKEIESLGFKVYVLDNINDIGGIIDEILTT